MTLKSEAKFERKLIYCVKNDKNLVTFDSSTHASKLGLWWDPFVQSRICISVKFTEELCARTMNNDTKFEENWLVVSKLTWQIWQILTQTQGSLENLYFDWFHLYKVYNIWPKKRAEELSSMTLKSHAKFEKNWLVVWKMRWRISKIFTRVLESLKIGTLMGSFYPK